MPITPKSRERAVDWFMRSTEGSDLDKIECNVFRRTGLFLREARYKKKISEQDGAQLIGMPDDEFLSWMETGFGTLEEYQEYILHWCKQLQIEKRISSVLVMQLEWVRRSRQRA
jgi:hypothetical protein